MDLLGFEPSPPTCDNDALPSELEVRVDPPGIEPGSPSGQNGDLPLNQGSAIGQTGIEPVSLAYQTSVLTIELLASERRENRNQPTNFAMHIRARTRGPIRGPIRCVLAERFMADSNDSRFLIPPMSQD